MLQPYLEANSKKDTRSLIKNIKDENPSTTTQNLTSWINYIKEFEPAVIESKQKCLIMGHDEF